MEDLDYWNQEARKDIELRIRIDKLIEKLQHEAQRPSSCTPDIVRRFEKAWRKHLKANGEN